MPYATTATIAGRYAYRAWDGEWYIVTRSTGVADTTPHASRQAAVAALLAA